MESRTYIKNVKSTPKKLRILAPAIASMSPQMALEYLQYTPKKGARIFHKAIKASVTAATAALKTDATKLVFKHLIVEEGARLKRHRAGSRGAARQYSKKMSHIKIILTAREPEVKKEVRAHESKVVQKELSAPKTHEQKAIPAIKQKKVTKIAPKAK